MTNRAATIRAFFDEPTNTVSYLVWDPATKRGAVIDPVLDWENRSGTADVAFADEGKKNQGEVIIRFFTQGYVQPAAIHLTDDERTMTLIFQPFLSTFEVKDSYVDVWQKSK